MTRFEETVLTLIGIDVLLMEFSLFSVRSEC